LKSRKTSKRLLSNVDKTPDSPEKAEVEREDHNKGIIQDAVHAAVWDRKRKDDIQTTHDASTLIADVEELRRGVTADTQYLKPLGFVIDEDWPDGTGRRPEMTQEQWEAIMDGYFCFKCRVRYRVPNQFRCDEPACYWTQEHTRRAVEYLYERRFMTWTPNRVH